MCRERFRRFINNYFDVSGKACEDVQIKFEDAELQVLINKDSCRPLEELLDELNVCAPTIVEYLRPMEMVHKDENWMSYKLKETDTERRLVSC